LPLAWANNNDVPMCAVLKDTVSLFRDAIESRSFNGSKCFLLGAFTLLCCGEKYWKSARERENFYDLSITFATDLLLQASQPDFVNYSALMCLKLLLTKLQIEKTFSTHNVGVELDSLLNKSNKIPRIWNTSNVKHLLSSVVNFLTLKGKVLQESPSTQTRHAVNKLLSEVCSSLNSSHIEIAEENRRDIAILNLSLFEASFADSSLVAGNDGAILLYSSIKKIHEKAGEDGNVVSEYFRSFDLNDNGSSSTNFSQHFTQGSTLDEHLCETFFSILDKNLAMMHFLSDSGLLRAHLRRKTYRREIFDSEKILLDATPTSLEPQESAIRVLSKVCELASPIVHGEYLIFLGALRRMLWLWLHSEGRLQAFIFAELFYLQQNRPFHSVHANLRRPLLPTIFFDLVPAQEFFLSCDSPFDIDLKRFLSTVSSLFIDPEIYGIGRSDGMAGDYIANVLPSVAPSFVIDQDYKSLKFCATLRHYLENQAAMSRRRSYEYKVDTSGVTKAICAEKENLTPIFLGCLLSTDTKPLSFLLSKVFDEKNVTAKSILESCGEQRVLTELLWLYGLVKLKDSNIVLTGDNSVASQQYITTQVEKALIRAACIKQLPEGSGRVGNISEIERQVENQQSFNSCLEDWVNESFMFLLVNLTRTRTIDEWLPPLQCLHLILGLLKPNESSQYLPQVLGIISTSMTGEKKTDDVKLLAIRCLSRFVDVLLSCQIETVGANLSSIVVTIFPVLTMSSRCGDLNQASQEAIEMLQNLVSGQRGKKMAPYFQNVLLPNVKELDSVREGLKWHNVDLDILRASDKIEDKLQREKELLKALRHRLGTISSLMHHETSSVRQFVMEHAIEVLKSHRVTFASLVESEESTGDGFITFSHGNSMDQTPRENGPVVSTLVKAIMIRFIKEQDSTCRKVLGTLAVSLIRVCYLTLVMLQYFISLIVKYRAK